MSCVCCCPWIVKRPVLITLHRKYMQKGHERGEVGGEGKKERCAIFCIKSCWWQAPPAKRHVNNWVLTVAWRRGLWVCVAVCGGFSVGLVGWCQMGAGGRSLSQLSLEGGWTGRCICVYVGVCVLCCAERACRLCIGRVHKHVVRWQNTHKCTPTDNRLKEWKAFLQMELVRMSQIWSLSGYGIMYSEPYYACFGCQQALAPCWSPCSLKRELGWICLFWWFSFVSSCQEEQSKRDHHCSFDKLNKCVVA